MFMKKENPFKSRYVSRLCKKKPTEQKDDFLYFYLLFNPPDMYIDMKDIQKQQQQTPAT